MREGRVKSRSPLSVSTCRVVRSKVSKPPVSTMVVGSSCMEQWSFLPTSKAHSPAPPSSSSSSVVVRSSVEFGASQPPTRRSPLEVTRLVCSFLVLLNSSAFCHPTIWLS